MKNTFDTLFTSDPDKSENGTPITFGVNAKGDPVIFYIAEAGCENHEKVQRKYAKQLERSRHLPARREEIISKIIAESLLIKWEGVLDEKGKEVEPTYENKLEALRKYKRLYNEIMTIALDHENFIEEDENPNAEEDTEKN